jgi:nitrogen fixation protein NifB
MTPSLVTGAVGEALWTIVSKNVRVAHSEDGVGEEELTPVAGNGRGPLVEIDHPCYGETAHRRYARLHLAVAPRCNLSCAYCDRRLGDCAHLSRPGLASRLLSPTEVPALVSRAFQEEPRLRVIGVAGPGEPLANPETFEALALAGKAWTDLAETMPPEMDLPVQPVLCLSTNGLLLEEKTPDLVRLGVLTVSVTVNAVSPEIGRHIYLEVRPDDPSDPAGRILTGTNGATLLFQRQMAGIRRATTAGLAVKVNTVLIPGVNWGKVPGRPAESPSEPAEIAAAAAAAGASLHNIVPLIPLGAMTGWSRPSCDDLRLARREAGRFLSQFRHCRQCRADAVGVPAEAQGYRPRTPLRGG